MDRASAKAVSKSVTSGYTHTNESFGGRMCTCVDRGLGACEQRQLGGDYAWHGPVGWDRMEKVGRGSLLLGRNDGKPAWGRCQDVWTGEGLCYLVTCFVLGAIVFFFFGALVKPPGVG